MIKLHGFYRELIWKELFIRFTVRVFLERLSICMYASFPFGFEGGVWDLIVIVPDHCFSFYLVGIHIYIEILKAF